MKTVLVFLFTLFIYNAISQSPENDGYKISGQFNGLYTGTITMLSIDGDSVLNKANIKNGNFKLQGHIATPELLLFNISPYSWNFRAFVENGELEFNIDTSEAQHFGNRNIAGKGWALIKEIEQKGSELASVYQQYINEIQFKYYNSEIEKWNHKLTALNSNILERKNLQNIIDSIRVVAESKRRAWIEAYVEEHPNSIAGTFILNEYYENQENIQVDDLLAILDRFESPATSSIYYQALVSLADDLQKLGINKLAPDFTLQTPNKMDFMLSSLKGNYILLDFWASWCAPCRKAIPNWKKVYEKYQDNGFTIVGISNDRNWNDWIKALEVEKMPWYQVIDHFPGKNQPAIVSELYKTNTLPHYVLIGREGEILYTTTSDQRMQEKIDETIDK